MGSLVKRLRKALQTHALRHGADGFELWLPETDVTEAADTIEAMEQALRLWQRYDALDSGTINGLTPMIAYGEAIDATDAALAKVQQP